MSPLVGVRYPDTNWYLMKHENRSYYTTSLLMLKENAAVLFNYACDKFLTANLRAIAC